MAPPALRTARRPRPSPLKPQTPSPPKPTPPPQNTKQENWAYDRATLYSFAKHYESGEPLPEALYGRLKAAKTYRAATMMCARGF